MVAAATPIAAVPARWAWPVSRSELALPVLIAVVAQLDVWPTGSANLGHVVGPTLLLSAVYLATALALVWRRRAPLVVLASITVTYVSYYLLFGAPEGLGIALTTLVAWYSVGRYAPVSSAVPGAALVVVGGTAHELADPMFRLSGLDVILWMVILAGWPVGYAFARREREAQELVASRDEAAQSAVAEERTRIARELHDVVGHGLSVSVLQLVAVLALLDKGEVGPARARVLNAERSAREALAEMRRLLGLLDGGAGAGLAPQPGLRQLEHLVDDTRSAGATVTLTVQGDPVELPPGLDLVAYRILQEALTNVLKHAAPPSAEVAVSYRSDSLGLEVRDHGRGIAAGASDGGGGGGRGLAGMRERARLYQGELEAGPCADGGYRVRAVLPVQAP